MLDKKNERILPYSKKTVFTAVIEAIKEHPKINLGEINEAQGMIKAHVGVSAWSWGEHLEIMLYETAPGSTALTVSSGSYYALVDWGKNQKNIDELMALIMQKLSSSQMQPTAAASNTPQCVHCGSALPAGIAKFCPSCGGAQPEPESQSQNRFCVSCGKPRKNDDAFCSECGAKQ